MKKTPTHILLTTMAEHPSWGIDDVLGELAMWGFSEMAIVMSHRHALHRRFVVPGGDKDRADWVLSWDGREEIRRLDAVHRTREKAAAHATAQGSLL